MGNRRWAAHWPAALGLAALVTASLSGTPANAQNAAAPHAAAQERYAELCAPCHGLLRYGAYAPPLLPQMLERRSDEQLQQIILDGLPQTQMQGFRDRIGAETAGAIAAWLRTPVEEVRWGLEQIAASRLSDPPDPVSAATASNGAGARLDRGETVLVVERGTGSVVVLEGDGLREAARFHVGQIHGGPKFTDDYGLVFASTRDGTLVRYNLRERRLEAKVKVGVNTRNVAASGDGRWVVAANQLPASLVVLDGDLRPLLALPLPGQPSAVYERPDGAGFVLTLRDRPLLIYLDVPSLRTTEVPLPQPFEDFVFVPGRSQLLASVRSGERILLYDLERRQVEHSIATSGLPHLFSAAFFLREGQLYTALNHIGRPTLSILNLGTFKVEKEIALRGAGYFVRTHPATPYLWADTNTDTVQLVDKATLTLREAGLRPQPGRKAMHVEFTADGRRALLSVWHPAGAVVVYDAKTLEEQARLPFNMPIGKYNARNKTHPPLH